MQLLSYMLKTATCWTCSCFYIYDKSCA